MTPVTFRRILLTAIFTLTTFSLAIAQEGKIRVNVTPSEAYIFVDGSPLDHRSNTLSLPVGEHTIGVYNFGFVPQVQKVFIEKGENPTINARLTAVPGMVSGPWGRIQIEGVPGNTLVFLNETKPEFFIGHADEINNSFVAKQRLVAPVGTHKLFLMKNVSGEILWSGNVEVRQNERLILHVKHGKGEMAYTRWHSAGEVSSLKRFEAGTASATIAVPAVTGGLTADHSQIKCGEPVRLTWNSAEAAQITVMEDGNVLSQAPSGELTLQPRQTTTYDFKALGPGGTVTSTATVRVDKTVQTSLVPAAQELRYVKVGDKIVEQGSTNLNWTASNADAIHIEPIGLVTGTSGSENVTAVPTKTTEGPIDEMQTFKITASNVCGGLDSSIASVHVTGSIEPAQVAEVKEPELPQTASPVPLLALFGLATLGSGLALRLFHKLR